MRVGNYCRMVYFKVHLLVLPGCARGTGAWRGDTAHLKPMRRARARPARHDWSYHRKIEVVHASKPLLSALFAIPFTNLQVEKMQCQMAKL